MYLIEISVISFKFVGIMNVEIIVSISCVGNFVIIDSNCNVVVGSKIGFNWVYVSWWD